MIVVDANVLIAWSAKKTPDLVLARLEHLLETAGKEKRRILIPTPALAEFLVRTDESTAEWLNELERKSTVDVCPFDRRAAFECALIERGAHQKGDKKHGADSAYQKVKFDRQIVAIAKSRNATLIVSDDESLRRVALSVGLQVSKIEQLPIPDKARQGKLPFKK
jgi:predicted nucleic acid-binding protein